MSEYVAVQYPEVTAKQLADEIWNAITDRSNAYYQVHKISEILKENGFYADETKLPKGNCDGE